MMNPWPDIRALDGQPSYVWSLDGGGRHLIVDLIRERQPKVFLEVGVFVGGSSLQWLENSPADMTLLAADIWDHGAEYLVFLMARKPAPWIVDMEPVWALQTPLKEHGIYKVALHNLRDFRDRVVPLRMPVVDLYGYVKTFIEPDIIYIDAIRNDRTTSLRMRPSRIRSCAVTIGSGKTLKATARSDPSSMR